MIAGRPTHSALEVVSGTRLPEARLSDSQRYAVVLQGAALLSHLAIAEWHSTTDWGEATIDGAGLLRGVRVEPGRPRQLVQGQLLDLCERLFGSLDRALGPSSRSLARRALAGVVERWRPTVVPLPADEAVRQLVDSAAFLWRATHASARTALAAEHSRGGERRVWVAGPGRFRRAVLAGAPDLATARRRLAAPGARSLWGRAPERRAGRHERGSGEALAVAQRSYAKGRYRQALAALHRQRGSEARVLRIRCMADLGRCDSARRSLQRVLPERLTPHQVLDLAEAAARVCANAGHLDEASQWVRRALAQGEPALRPRAELLAAAAAWDRGDLEAMGQRLRTARPALDRRELAWRWHHLDGLLAISSGDPRRAVETLRLGLAKWRRQLTAAQAAVLWNELAIGRAMVGDLAGAERALHHSLVLLRPCEGPRSECLNQVNLAEVRMRRGRLRGVQSLFEASARHNRRAGNLRAWAYDQELLARHALAVGQPEAALERADAALDDLRSAGSTWRQPELEAVAARALGWLGRPEEAAERLDRGGAEGVQVFEPEERPALWALAGRRQRALREEAGGVAEGAWLAVLAGGQLGPGAWESLAALEPYRQARWTYDVELCAAGALPPERLRWAAAVLRAVGAEPMASRLGDRVSEAWGALRRYLEGWSEDSGPRLAEIERIFGAAGCPEAHLTWEHDGKVRTLLAGSGGDRELAVRLQGGRLVLRARRIDQRAKALFALAVRDLRSRLEEPAPSATARSSIVGESPRLVAALERADLLARGAMPVLILGETGTGKELVARRIHRSSPRRERPLLAINCAALSRSLLLSELFGHARGAFTGADRDRAGIFEEAAGGTVLLDEVGDLPLDAQGSLLRILQEGESRRLGESRPRKVDVRIVAATHRDLHELAGGGSFREDLLFRLQAATVRLPPLRERGEDIERLAHHFLARLGHRGGLSAAAAKRLLSHSWPGNVRELRNCLEVGAALAGNRPIPLELLDLPVEESAEGLYHRRIREVRERLVGEALEAAGGNQAAAARRLGITRQAFSYLVRRLELPREGGGE
jgi:DNA-binding NtrC family response regulator/tetratricopeptide (TPR) repeat protein